MELFFFFHFPAYLCITGTRITECNFERFWDHIILSTKPANAFGYWKASYVSSFIYSKGLICERLLWIKAVIFHTLYIQKPWRRRRKGGEAEGEEKKNRTTGPGCLASPLSTFVSVWIGHPESHVSDEVILFDSSGLLKEGYKSLWQSKTLFVISCLQFDNQHKYLWFMENSSPEPISPSVLN